MATKTITITEDAYEVLATYKTTNDSFSDVIKKHFKKESLLDLVGVLSNEEAVELRKHISDRRKASRMRIKHIAAQL